MNNEILEVIKIISKSITNEELAAVQQCADHVNELYDGKNAVVVRLNMIAHDIDGEVY